MIRLNKFMTENNAIDFIVEQLIEAQTDGFGEKVTVKLKPAKSKWDSDVYILSHYNKEGKKYGITTINIID